MTGLYYRTRYHLMRTALRACLPVHYTPDLVRLGSDYGGWIVPSGLLEPGSRCYSAGLGEDGSFDRELALRYGCQVFVLDPTPRAVAYAESYFADVRSITFHPIGLWSEAAVLRFYAPADATHVSHSVLNLQRTSSYFEAPCLSVAEFMAAQGHHDLVLLKLDIEGAEYAVLTALIRDAILPTILCVEFDQPVFVLKTALQIVALRRAGYRIVAIDRWNYTFVRETHQATAQG